MRARGASLGKAGAHSPIQSPPRVAGLHAPKPFPAAFRGAHQGAHQQEAGLGRGAGAQTQVL